MMENAGNEFSAIISKNFNYNFGKVLQISRRITEKFQYSMEIYTPAHVFKNF